MALIQLFSDRASFLAKFDGLDKMVLIQLFSDGASFLVKFDGLDKMIVIQLDCIVCNAIKVELLIEFLALPM